MTGGAGSEGAFYVYSKGRPGGVRDVGPGQGFLVRGINEVPIIRIATDEEMQKHFDDTATGDGDDGDEGDENGDDGTTGTVGEDLAGGAGSDDGSSSDGSASGFDPGSDPTPTDPLFTEPPPEPFTPESLPEPEPTVPVIEGTWSDEWSTTNFSFSSETGVLAVDGTINILHSEEPAILDFYSWTPKSAIGVALRGEKH